MRADLGAERRDLVAVLARVAGEEANLEMGDADRAEPALVMVAFTGDGYPKRPTYEWTLDLKDVYFMNSLRALSALWLEAPLLDGPLVFAKYHPALVPELRARFPDRRFFLYVVRDDAPGGDELIGGAPRGHSSAGEKAVEPLAALSGGRGHCALPLSCAAPAVAAKAPRLSASPRGGRSPMRSRPTICRKRSVVPKRRGRPGVSWRSTSVIRPRRSRLSSTASQLTPLLA